MRAIGDERAGGTEYLETLRSNWALIALTVVVGVGSAAYFVETAAKRYEAKSDLLVSPVSPSDDSFLGIDVIRDSSSDPNRGVITAARFVKTPQVIAAVQSRLAASGFRVNIQRLTDSVKAEPVSQSDVVSISAVASSPTRAAQIANTFASETLAHRTALIQRQVKEVIAGLSGRLAALPANARQGPEAAALGTRLASLRPLLGRPDPTMTIMTRALPPTSSSWPKPALTLVVSLLASLLVGIGAAVARDLFNPHVSEDELVFGLRLPVLTRVPQLSQKTVSAFLAHRKPTLDEVREAFRTLRANLAFSRTGGFPRTILITSAISGEGKTLASSNLAITIAAGGERVLLIDGDLRRGMQATVFGVAAGSGLSDVLLGKMDYEQAVVPAPGQPNLRLLLSGAGDADLIDLIEVAHADRVLEQMKEDVDVIIIDSSPLTEFADALAWAAVADVVLITVRIGRSRRDRIGDLRQMMSQSGMTPAGVIVTAKQRPRTGDYYGSTPGQIKLPGIASRAQVNEGDRDLNEV